MEGTAEELFASAFPRETKTEPFSSTEGHTVYLHLRRGPTGIEVSGQASAALGGEPWGSGHRDAGAYARWHWDGTTLRLETDRFGIYPIFYFSTANEFIVSNRLGKLLERGVPSDLDYPALGVFLRYFFFVAEETPFRSIRAFPPGARVEWNGSAKAQVSGGIDFPKALPWKREDAIQEYLRLFRQSMERRLNQNAMVLLPLSGGKDSRHILLELCRAGAPPELVFTAELAPPRNNGDLPAARRLAKRVGVPHLTLRQPRRRLPARRMKDEITSYCSEEHSWTPPVRKYLEGKGALIFDGLAGDTLSAKYFLTKEKVELAEQGLFREAAKTIKRRDESILKTILAPEFYSKIDERDAFERVLAELERHAAAADPLGSFQFWNRTRRKVALAPYAMLAQVTQISSPYLDDDVFDFLRTIPAALMLGRKFHEDTIRCGFPEYADVPYEPWLRPDRGWTYRSFALELLAETSTRRSSSLLRLNYLRLRYACSAITGKLEDVQHLDFPLAAYLLNLETALTKGAELVHRFQPEQVPGEELSRKTMPGEG